MAKLSAGKCALTCVVIVLGIFLLGLVIWYLSNIRDPWDGKTPAVIEQFTGVKTLCENRVKNLKGAKIDGEAEYVKVQLETNKCIGWLQGILDKGYGDDDEEIEKRLKRVDEMCNEFNQWAESQLLKGAAESIPGDLAKAASDVLKLLDKQEKDRREAVKKSLENCKLSSWADIPARAGALK